MSVENIWYIKKLVAYSKFSEVLSVVDLKYTVDALYEFTHPRTCRIHHIADMQQVERVAASINQFRAAVVSIDKLPVDWVVFINPRQNVLRHLVNYFAETSFQFIRIKCHSVDTFEEAVTFLAKQDDFVAEAMQVRHG